MTSSVAYPVRALREHVTEMEAAISVCLANPDVRPVHKLRTETRRVEALLVLVGLVPGLPEHRKESAALVRVLRKLRRAAGEVRDLDVHRKMLEDFAEREDALAEKPSSESPATDAGPAGGGQNDGYGVRAEEPGLLEGGRDAEAQTDDAATKSAATLSHAAGTLRKGMGRRRDKAAKALCKVLATRQGKVARAAESLLDVLKPGEGLSLAGNQLLSDAESVLTRDGLLTDDVAKLSRDELHTVRKAAKAARYVAESLPEDGAVAAAAQRFEALQEAGGLWHDAWQLAHAAQQRFGKAHELTVVHREDRDRKLAAYRKALQTRQQETAVRTDARQEEMPPLAPRLRNKRSATKKAPVREKASV